MKNYKRHFRIYFKNNHPAYIVDEEGNMYVFHRATHSKTSGSKKNWKIKPNPIKGHNEPMYIVKQEQKDNKSRFSVFEIELKNGVDVSYPDIKRASTPNNLNDKSITISSNKSINANFKKKKK